jgi:dTMP kinase
VGAFAPDLTVLLDLPVHVGLHRAGQRPDAAARYESLETAFHQRLREGFLQIAAAEPERCVVIDSDRPPEVVAEAVWDALVERLGVPA